MLFIQDIYKDTALSDTELHIVQEQLSSPTLKKYFKMLAQNDLAELALLGLSNLSDSEVAKKHALVQGKLSTIVTLLSIQKPKE